MKTTTESEPNSNGNVFSKTIPLFIAFSMLGVTKKLKDNQVEVDADKEMITASKKILDCEEYKNISTIKGEITSYLRKRSVPGGSKLFRSATFPIPTSILQEVDEYLKKKISTFMEAVRVFCEVYEQRKSEAMERLRGVADFEDYPPIEKVKKAFRVEYEYVSFGPPQGLKGVSKDLYEREMEKVKANCQQAAEQVQMAMRGMLQDLLDHMVTRLTPGPDGKKPIFKDTLVGNMMDFLKDFGARNITDDKELEEVVNKCKNLLQGKNPNLLRKDDDARTRTAEALAKVKSQVDAMIGKSGRKFNIREE